MRNLITFTLLITCALSTAQLSLTSTGTDFAIDFDQTTEGINNSTFAGTGFSPNPAVGQLNSNGIIVSGLSDGTINFGDSQTDGDFARGSSSGSKTTGGIYAFEVATNNFALGVQPGSSDFTPGDIVLKIQNSTGQALSELSVQYDILCFNNADRSSKWTFGYSSDNGDNYTYIDELFIDTPENLDANPLWNSSQRTTTININIPQGASFYLKWTCDDAVGSGSRDEMALDNIIINGSSTPGTPTSAVETSHLETNIFPNPFNSFITIESAKNIERIEIINAAGQTIYLKEGDSFNSLTIDTKNITKGIYLIKWIDKEGDVRTRKLLK